MGVDLIGRTEHDVNLATVAFPSRDRFLWEALIRVGHAPVVLFFVFVLLGVRGGVAPQPKLFDER